MSAGDAVRLRDDFAKAVMVEIVRAGMQVEPPRDSPEAVAAAAYAVADAMMARRAGGDR